MRTIKEIAEILKKEDPQTKLTVRAIRYLINTGQLPSVQIGSKYLVSLEVLEAFLKGELKKPENEVNESETATAYITPIEIHKKVVRQRELL